MKNTENNLKRFTLPNGLTVLFYKMNDVMSASAVLFVRTGAIFEKEEERGISHLVEHSAFIGTQKYPTSQTISNFAENLGIFYNGGTSKDSTFYTIKSPHMNLHQGLELLSQFVFAPLLDEGRVLKEKEIILSEYNDFWNDPIRRFEHEMWRKRFLEKEHPYSWRPMGKPETVKNLNLKMVMDWRKKYYNPSNMVLSIAANFNEKDLKNSIESLFGHTNSEVKQEEPKFNSDNYSNFLTYLEKDERQQITFNITFPTFGSKEVDRIKRTKLRLLSTIFGSSRSSRLYTRLREKEKFVYKMFCERRLLSWMGALVVGGSTSAQNLIGCMAAIKEEISRLVEYGITEDELNLAKNLSEAQVLLQFDNPAEIARYFGEETFYEKDILYPEQQIENIKRINKSDIDSLLKEIFDFSKINIGFLGDVKPEVVKEVENIFKP